MEEFPSSQELQDKFIWLVHQQIPKRELMSEFYAMSQEPQESVPHFIIRFQNLRRQLTRQIPADELKDTISHHSSRATPNGLGIAQIFTTLNQAGHRLRLNHRYCPNQQYPLNSLTTTRLAERRRTPISAAHTIPDVLEFGSFDG